jgi:hypothetical protein
VRLAHFLDPFDLLHADVEQRHGRTLDMKERARHRRTHQGIVGQLACVGPDVGADVEHDAFGFHRRPQGRDRGTLDARHRTQDQFRHRHQRAGVAGGDGDVRLTLLHGLDREPHARALATPHGLARLVAHRDRGVGVDDRGPCGDRGRLLELGLDACAVAEDEEAQIGVALQREGGAANHNLGAMIAPHRVERYRPRL